MFSSDAILGSIAAGAIGDALGGLLERRELCLSDDTQLTLATCEAPAETGTATPAGVAAALARWFRARRVTGIGSSTLKALRDLDAGAHWALAGARGEMAAGNGAAMRIAPLAFVVDPSLAEHRTTVRDICRITHHSDEAYIGALAVIIAIHLEPGDDSRCLAAIAEPLPDSRVRDALMVAAGLPPDEPIADIASRLGASGYVVETVPLALLLASRMTRENFEACLRCAAEVPGDMDTICSIAGQVAGSRFGLTGLPPALLALEPVTYAVSMARPFANAVGGAA